jgi:lipid-A-disaccharide synthase
MASVPMVLAYKLDTIARPFGFLIKTWSAALPNLIADYVVVPEEVNETASRGRLTRHLERLLNDTPERAAQLAGLQFVKETMQVDQPPGEKAADIVFDYLTGNRG